MNIRKYKYKNDKNKSEKNDDNYLGAKIKEITSKNLNTTVGHIYSQNILQN